MEIGNLIPHIESLIFASEKPLTTLELTELINQAFGFMEDKIVLDQVEAAIQGIIEKYSSEYFPFEVRESGGGWQFLTKKDYHKTVAQLNGDKFLKRLSTAALETLSIIAYKQPITKAEIEAIRGVSSDYAIQKLLEKELVAIIGRNESLPGHPLIYATSKSFMDYFGINSTDDLPKLKDVIDDSAIAPSVVNEEGEAVHDDAPEVFEPNVEDTSFTLEVDENGQLIEVLHFSSNDENKQEESNEESEETNEFTDEVNDNEEEIEETDEDEISEEEIEEFEEELNEELNNQDDLVESQDDSVESSDELVESSDEPVESSDEPVESSDEPVKSSDELVESSDELVESSDELVESHKDNEDWTEDDENEQEEDEKN